MHVCVLSHGEQELEERIQVSTHHLEGRPVHDRTIRATEVEVHAMFEITIDMLEKQVQKYLAQV